MIDPRALLIAYALEAVDMGDISGYLTRPDGTEVYGISRGYGAPKVFSALRAVLDLADHYDDIGDRMWTESAADDIRSYITEALETDRG